METEHPQTFYTPQDAAKACGVSAETIKRYADELRLDVLRTVGGIRIFTSAQVEAIWAERQRRAMEAAR